MAQIVGNGLVISGITITKSTTVKTQSVAIAGRKNQTITIQTDQPIVAAVEISQQNDINSNYFQTLDTPLAVTATTPGTLAINYTANFMRLAITAGGGADATPTGLINSLPTSR